MKHDLTVKNALFLLLICNKLNIIEIISVNEANGFVFGGRLYAGLSRTLPVFHVGLCRQS